MTESNLAIGKPEAQLLIYEKRIRTWQEEKLLQETGK